ncbi:MAG: hypothetical protein COZ06_32995 [Armatimonadetes bacterium CG_4_10_14_3_um_filter_66_18]|nr:1-acyl-sn-glycerol-3-phosphate acyltransferase [Armatimonadota bacterium]PIU89081.1 MAG: hypothetical protein COS65_29255 [Armatimonadetes bacterium CG06_land_8_20_14_3_00_66_21]PIX49379.1 MAG: hypothetical protein COZ57_03570 [Armatimonadetes bacterium CG_4_8_14_3_um_filter_66_20]PIY37400.1 MAG: hypothetical protein COZ06_32995 [Armatimonadetes bacterium CG_4_10_14_3_um_filter_66_18]PIZ49308.1 MAG: hypothetical protein COY42_04295 [Armatimonadetes bacterium CG_4_10_14_0_8_um_filter_66_14]P
MRSPDPFAPPSPQYRVLQPLIYAGIRAVLAACGGIRMSGQEHVPRSGGVLVVCNHLSVCDPPVVAICTPRPVWFVAREYLFGIPVLSPLITAMLAFPIDSLRGQRRALDRAAEVLRAGNLLVMYPEGRCSPTGELGAFQRGAALVAREVGAPVVPFAAAGTGELIRVGRLLPQRLSRPLAARFGPPVDLSGMEGMTRQRWLGEATARMHRAMAGMVARVCAERAALNVTGP